MREIGRISQVVWQEIQLRLLDRIKLPPVNYVRAENQLHRPHLTEYQYGVKASLIKCLSLTLIECLQLIDISSLDARNLDIFYKFS